MKDTVIRTLRASVIILMALCVASCTPKGIDVTFESASGRSFFATIENEVDTDTRVYADHNLRVLWNADDRISVFDKSTANKQYRFMGETGSKGGTFKQVEGGAYSGTSVPGVWAVYPYNESASITDTGVLTFEFPSTQTYKNNSFGPGANVMIAAGNDDNLLFKNACGILVIKLYGKDKAVRSITLKGNNGEKICGPATITMAAGGVPSVQMSESAGTEITLLCNSPVLIGTTAESYTEFWFELPPVVFTKGLSIVVNCEDCIFMEETSNLIAVSRSSLSRMAPVFCEKKDFKHKSLVLMFTSEWCDVSPSGEKEMKYIDTVMDNKYNRVIVYCNGLGSDPFSITGSSSLESLYLVYAYPTFIVDGRNEGDGAVLDIFEELVSEQELLYPPTTGITLSTSVSLNELSVTGRVYSHLSETFMLSVFLLESGIIDARGDTQNNVLRASLSNILGDSFELCSNTGTYDFYYSITVPESYKKDNLSVLVAVQRNFGSQVINRTAYYGDYYFDNCVCTKIGESIPLQIIGTVDGNGNEEITVGDEITF